MRAVCLAVLGLALAVPASAQERPHHVCRLPVLPGSADAVGKGGDPRARPSCDAPSARFEVTYDGFPADAERAFAAAVETWSCLVASDVPIRIAASWEALGAGVLGSAGPFLARNFDGAPARDTWYGTPLAEALSGDELRTDADIDALFNSTFPNWHLDPDVTPDAADYDLYTVVLHELGHGLGFIGNLTVRAGLGRIGTDEGVEGPFVYDRFTEGPDGGFLLALGDGTAALADALEAATAFDGVVARRVGGPFALYAPERWEEGGSYSHFAESAFARGTPDGLMTPFIGRGEAIDEPGTAVCALLADLGWRLAGACAERVGPVAPVGAPLAITVRGPNPVRGDRDLVFAVQATVPQRGRVTLVDTRGRTVTRLFDGELGPEPETLRVDAKRLASGVYLVVAEANGQRLAEAVTVVR